jgi:hypothetical protein
MRNETLHELPVVGGAPAPLHQRLQTIRRELVGLDETATARRFELVDFERLLKSTISLCPDCLSHVGCAIYIRDGRVLMRKRCANCGLSDAVVENDERFYFLSNKDQWGRRFADDRVIEIPQYGGNCCEETCCDGGLECGPGEHDITDQMSNKTCTLLVEVTNACNLACPVCYADARGDRKMELDTFKQHILRLIDAKGGLDSVQITGGEAALHPEFWDMVSFLYDQPLVKKIYLPTNGIVFAQQATADRLKPFREKLMVLLQFDGRGGDVDSSLRGANLSTTRNRVIEHLSRASVPMQLTMTISAGVNERDVGWVIDTGLAHENIRVVALQPATYSGRYDLPPSALERVTLSDVVKAVIEQASKRMQCDDFVPIPCSHPNCGWITLLVRRFGLEANIVKYIDLPRAMNSAAYKTLLSTNEVRDLVESPKKSIWSRVSSGVARRLIRSSDVFAIAVKPFMDRFSYDQDRISACCHHMTDTQGRPVSFCEYNALLRQADSWDRFPRI